MSDWHLQRSWYPTDVSDEDLEYPGAFSGTIPAGALRDGRHIVDVDWSERGWVAVTYLTPGPGHVRGPETAGVSS